ncbi:hypothetical protein VTK26DRAFT_7003 [Humicola hyalothermophila]
MTSSSLVPEAGCGPNSLAAPDRNTLTQAREAHTTNAHNNSPSSSDSHLLHTHRQNHNSSKLPAFRFADLKRDRISLPSLLQHIPPSPVSSREPSDIPVENQQQEVPQGQTRTIPGPSRDSFHHHRSAKTLSDKPASIETAQRPAAPVSRSRSLKIPLPSSTIAGRGNGTPSADSSLGSKRPASFPDTPRAIGGVYATRSQSSNIATPVRKRRLTASAVAQNTTPAARGSQPRSGLQQSPETHQTEDPTLRSTGATKESAQGQQESSRPEPIDAGRSDDTTTRPPVSSRPTHKANTSTGHAAIPPVRSFRTSGSRKSVVLDMHSQRVSDDSLGEGATDHSQRDRALRTLEGREDDESSQLAPAEFGETTTTTDNDNTADIFMKIARENTPPRPPEAQAAGPSEPSVISRIIRTSHRRPLSAAVSSNQAPSLPEISRRLSDQRESSRTRTESLSAQQNPKELSSRATTVENPTPIITTHEGLGRTQSGRAPLRPSPITPRQFSFKESFAEGSSAYQRRRQSLTESNNSSTRTTPHRSFTLGPSQTRTYGSSPLVPKPASLQREDSHGSDANPGIEGTESSNSTAAPSTVWDELDDLKSRIHRLELTGKMPPASRVPDDRPRTATTNATTMSASPKRVPTQPDGEKSASLPRETQPLLLSALQKAKGSVSSDVFNAIESAATGALALVEMLGAAGEPGPISSSASAVGYGGSVTNRQLRRKADSICRNLTELCLVLADEAGRHKEAQPTAAAHEKDLLSPASPQEAMTVFQRRRSAVAEMASKPDRSPRAPSRLEQRRQTLLASAAVSSPSLSPYVTAPGTPLEPSSTGRKSSLLLARIRRVGTEEPEETPGRRSALLFRSRRSGTEELEDNREGRRTSLLLRSRKTVNDEDDAEPRFRAPSRAVTEVNGFRGGSSREISTDAQSPPENSPHTPLALPRRRFIPSSLHSRLLTSNSALSAAPSPVTPARRYLERSTPLSDPINSSHSFYSHSRMTENLSTPDDRSGPSQRQLSLSQTAMLNRTGSIGRRGRDTSISSYSSSPAQQQHSQE